MEKAIAWFNARLGRTTYSMTHRFGPYSYDCSSAVYYALIEAGVFPQGTQIGNTETLFIDLERNGFRQLPLDANGDAATQRGDIFIWGRRGHTLGAAGHTGIFVDEGNIVHSNYGHNGISINSHDGIWALNGQPAYTFYRYYGKPAPVVETYKAIKGIHQVSERKVYEGIEQVLSPTLYGSNPDWEDNGIPVNAINKVSGTGYHLQGKTMPGELFVVPGKFKVLRTERDERNGQIYSLLQGVGGYDVWVLNSALSDEETKRPDPEPVIQPEPQPEPKPSPELNVDKPETPADETTEEKQAPESPSKPSGDEKMTTILEDIKNLLESLLSTLKSIFKKG